jgi:alpha-1,6-mannosyltransferase
MRRASEGDHRPSTVVAVFALWAVPLVLGPPLMTRDVYSNAAQGEIYSQGIDPYHHGPEVLGGGEFFREVDPLWRTTAAPYGPFFLVLTRTATQIARHRLIPAVVLLKIVCLAGVALMAIYLPRLARASGHRPQDALAFVLLNPITLLHLVGGAHNEAIMVGLLVMGLSVAMDGRPLSGVVLCSLAGAVKIPALAGAVFIAWHWAEPASSAGRLRRLALCAASSAGTFAALAIVTRTSWGWITLIRTPTLVQSYLSPVTTTGLGIGATLGLLGIPKGGFLAVWQLIFIGLALALSARWLLRVRQDGLARSTGSALLAVAVLSPVLFPFYLMWGLAPLGAAGLRRYRPVAIFFCVTLSMAILPGGRDLAHAVAILSPWWAAGLLAALVVVSIPASSVEGRGVTLPVRAA